MILNIMHHVHHCNRVLEVRRGLMVSIELPHPHQSQVQLICALAKRESERKKKSAKSKFNENHWGNRRGGGIHLKMDYSTPFTHPPGS